MENDFLLLLNLILSGTSLQQVWPVDDVKLALYLVLESGVNF